jgi:hypothetical protein
MEPLRTHTDIEKSNQSCIDKQGARIAQAPEPPWRRPKRRIEQGDGTKPTKASGEVNIFHDRDVRETPQLAKNIGLHKERLIAEKWPCNLADAPQQSLPPCHPDTPIVESPMKRPSDYSLRAGSPHQRGKMLWPELGVGMMETEESGACDLRSGIHLRSPRRFLTNNEAYSTGSFQVSQALRWLHGRDNPFNGHMIDLQPVNQINNQSVIAPDREDQRNKRTVDRVHSCHHTQDLRNLLGKERPIETELAVNGCILPSRRCGQLCDGEAEE